MSGPGCAILVTVDIKPDRIDDFLKAAELESWKAGEGSGEGWRLDKLSSSLVMEQDAVGSRDRTMEPGCLRFDLLRDRELQPAPSGWFRLCSPRDNPNRFVFYEAYVNDDAVTHHKTTAHYKAWADFKATGGVEKQSEKAECTSLPSWAFQTEATGSSTSAAVLVTVDIKAGHQIESFLKVMEADAMNSRNKDADRDPEIEPGCLRFDLMKDREKPNRPRLVVPNDEAIGQHKTTAHYKGWADFKAAGGVEHQAVMKLETAPGLQIFLNGGTPKSSKTLTIYGKKSTIFSVPYFEKHPCGEKI
eukprot:Skav207908  [mRNA]  locus=scaffold190:150429:155847:- [translate_table: standard]